MSFSVFLLNEADDALHQLSLDDYNFCTSKIAALGINPYPGVGGDKEKLKGRKDNGMETD